MSDLVGVDSSNCSNGHKLIGRVKYCPFCGEEQVEKAMPVFSKASDVTLEPTKKLEDKKPQNATKVNRAADTGKAESRSNVKSKESVVEKEDKVVLGYSPSQADESIVPTKEKSLDSANFDKNTPKLFFDYRSKNVNFEENKNRKSRNVNEKIGSSGDQGNKPRPSVKNWGAIFLILVSLLLGGIYFYTSSDKNTPCLDKLRIAREQMGSGQLNAANGTASEALSICQGESLNKANALKKEIQQLVQSDANCQKLFAKVQSLQQRRLLTSAKDTLLNGNSICVVNPNGKNLNKSLTNLIDQSNSQVEKVEAAIRGGDQVKAKELLMALKSVHADNPNIQELQADISKMAIGGVVPTPEPNDAREAKPAPSSLVVGTPAVPAPSNTADKDRLIQRYLEKAEIALKQNQFDTAKTQVENAIELDDKNQAARQMGQKIKSAEKAYLENTIIFK